MVERIKNPILLKRLSQASDYYNKGRYRDAISVYKSLLLSVDDKYTYDKSELYRNLGNCYWMLQDWDSAAIAYEGTLKYYTNNASIYNTLGYLYYFKDAYKACEYYLKGLNLQPDFYNLKALAQIIIRNSNYNVEQLKEIFEKYINLTRSQILGDKEAFKYNPKDYKKDKKLKIGYMSSDFYCHAMMQFVLPIIENHDLNNFEIYFYSCNDKNDFVTDRIKRISFNFIDCSSLKEYELAKRIHDDNIDILVDLSGYYGTNQSFGALLFKPAPIICQYLGFLGTYGMKEVDYIFADEFIIPKETSKYYTEKPLYIDEFMNRFTFNTENLVLPDITPLPYFENGYFTFGSFNSISKINAQTVSLWSKLLKRVDNSKLLIYRTQLKQEEIDKLKKEFNENGIEDNRLIFDNTPMPTHFQSYQKCDVALDALHFSGLTVTIEQLSMGIPVLTHPQKGIASRGSAGINRMLGLVDYIADSEEEYVEKGAKIASDIETLKDLRANLRNMTQKKIFRGHMKYVSNIEKRYRKIFEDFVEK